MNRLKNITESLAETMTLLSEGDGEGEEEVTTDSETPADAEAEGEEPAVEETEEPAVEETDAEATESVLHAIGHEIVLNLFGKQLNHVPSWDRAAYDKAEVSEEVAPFLENFHTLTKPLYEDKAPDVYIEHYQLAAALYSLAESAGLDYEAVLEMDLDQLGGILDEALKDYETLDEALPALAAIGRGAVAAGSKVAQGAAKLAGKAGGWLAKKGAGALKAGAREAGKAGAEHLAKKAKAKLQPEAVDFVHLINRVRQTQIERAGSGKAKGDMQYSDNGIRGSVKLPKGNDDRNPGRGTDARAGLPVKKK